MAPRKITITAMLAGLIVGAAGMWLTLNYINKPKAIQLPRSVASTATLKVNYIPYQIETLTAVTTSQMNDERNPPFIINDAKNIETILQNIRQSPTSLSIQLNDGRIRARLTYGDTVYFIDAEGNCLSSRFESHKIEWGTLSKLFPSDT